MKELLKEAKKLGVATQKNITLQLPSYESSAKKIVEGILNFLKEHNVEDAYWEVRSRERYGDVETECEVSILVDKTEDELRADVKAHVEKHDRWKEQRRKQFEELKKEFNE